MPWMTRPNGRAYLYKSIRVNGRVKSVYVPIDKALVTHRADTERREAIRVARRQAACDRSIVEAAQRALHDELDQMLAQAGYHLHRGELRKRRNMQTTSLVHNQELLPSPIQTEADTLAQRAVLLMVEVRATATGAVEQLLVQEVALAWIELFRLRMGYANLPPAQSAFRTRSIDSAQLRWLRSVEILRRIQQRMALPVDG